MLKEIKDVRQNEGEPFRRIFSAEDLSLTIWFKGSSLCGFQIRYEEENVPLLFTWDEEKGYSNKIIDQGESRTFRHKMSAIPVADKKVNKDFLLHKLKEVFPVKKLPNSDLILDKIRNWD